LNGYFYECSSIISSHVGKRVSSFQAAVAACAFHNLGDKTGHCWDKQRGGGKHTSVCLSVSPAQKAHADGVKQVPISQTPGFNGLIHTTLTSPPLFPLSVEALHFQLKRKRPLLIAGMDGLLAVSA
jgi:hypothetical protein